MQTPPLEEIETGAAGSYFVPVSLNIVEDLKRAEYNSVAESARDDKPNKRRKRDDDNELDSACSGERDHFAVPLPPRKRRSTPYSDRSDLYELARLQDARHADNESAVSAPSASEDDIARLHYPPRCNKEYTVDELKKMCPSACAVCLQHTTATPELQYELDVVEKWIVDHIKFTSLDQLAIDVHKYWEEVVRDKYEPDPGDLPYGDIRMHFIKCRADSTVLMMERLRKTSAIADSAANMTHVKNPVDGTIKLDRDAVDIYVKMTAMEQRILNQVNRMR